MQSANKLSMRHSRGRPPFPEPFSKMSKIRLLFAPENIGFAEKISNALAAAGYEATVNEEPSSAALVIWSPAAAASAAILSAARNALARRVLVPVALGKAPPPPSFEHLWPMDLAGWMGRDDDPRWRFVLDEIELAMRRGVEFVAPDAAGADAGALQKRGRGKRPALRAARAEHAVAIDPAPVELGGHRRPSRSAPKKGAPGVLIGAFGAATVIAGLAGAAFFFGGERAAPVVPAHAAPPPVVAFVTPDDQPADDLSAAAADAAPVAEAENEGVADELAAIVDAPEDAPETDAITPAETLRDIVVADALTMPADAPATDDAALTETTSEAGDPVAEVIVAAANEADPIAGLAWESTRDEAVETASFGAYLRDCLDCPDLAEISAGSILPDGEGGDLSAPLFLTRRIAVAVRETTFDEWQACVDDGACTARPDNGWGRGKRPVVNVSWAEAQAYAQWLSARTGHQYRLPTQEEWEYAARAGSAAAYSFGDTAAPTRANYGGVRGSTAITGSFSPNAFGLFDMHGNVAEWTADCWTPTLAGEPTGLTPVNGLCSARAIKGGGWKDAPEALAASRRDGDVETARRSDVGFRVVRNAY